MRLDIINSKEIIFSPTKATKRYAWSNYRECFDLPFNITFETYSNDINSLKLFYEIR